MRLDQDERGELKFKSSQTCFEAGKPKHDGRSAGRVEAHQRGQSRSNALVCVVFALFTLDNCYNLSFLMCSVCCITEGGAGWLADCFHLNHRNDNRKQGGFPSTISTRG